MAEAAYQWTMTAPAASFTRRDFNPFPPGSGEVVVAVAGCGVCHTDLGYLYDGVRTNHALPVTLGHEISGRVMAAGPGEEHWLGQSVIVPAVLPCGVCDLCRRGLATICRGQKMPGNDIDGGFASHIRVPGRGLCPVDPARLAAAGLTLADVSVVADAVTTPFQAVRRAGVGAESVAIVVGIGGVGGYAAQVAHAFGAAVVAIDIDAEKLADIGRHGAVLTLDARTLDARALKAAVAEFAAGHGLRQTEWCIFECSGTAAGQRTAWSLLVPGATLAVVGFTMERIELRLSNLMAFDARALGNWGCPPELYPAALDLVLDGKVQLKPFVEPHPLDDINAVFAAAHAHTLKRRAILVPAA